MSSVSDTTRAQYEAYPYPPREPADEQHRLLAPVADSLDYLNHYGFSGRRDFDAPFRVLVAGGGTGDSLVFLAEQLRDRPATVVYLDVSSTSMGIAKARAHLHSY